MAKASKASKASKEEATETEHVAPVGKVVTPDGFEDVSSDIAAVYDFKVTASVFVTPLHYTLSDAKDGKKPQILIHCDLLKPAVLVDLQDDTSEEKVAREFPAGTRVGIWYRPGLRNIMQCAGTATFIAFEGERDVGQIQPMKMFKVSRKKGANAAELPLSADYRKNTRHMPLPWEGGPGPKTAKGSTQPAANDDDDVPF
jgi:hypothetical protein